MDNGIFYFAGEKYYTRPMTDKEREKNIGKPLQMPVRYHLVDCLKDLKCGRLKNDQDIINNWIAELYENLDKMFRLLKIKNKC